MKKCAAEFIGTFGLVFAGTGAIVVNEVSHGAITHVGIALTFGLIVMVMIYTLGDISGAHINPAVTIGFWLSRRLPGRDVVAYVISQAAGAIAASALMRPLFRRILCWELLSLRARSCSRSLSNLSSLLSLCS